MSYIPNNPKPNRRNLIKTLKGINHIGISEESSELSKIPKIPTIRYSDERKANLKYGKNTVSKPLDSGIGSGSGSGSGFGYGSGIGSGKGSGIGSEIGSGIGSVIKTGSGSRLSVRTEVKEALRSPEGISKNNLRDFLDEILGSDPANSHDKVNKEDMNEYLNNYQEMNFSGKDKMEVIYQSFLKQNKHRERIKHLAFLDNQIIKSENLINTYFDRIYVLNLDRRPDRWDHMKKNLDKLGVYNYERFSATDGSQAPHYQEWKHYSKMPLTRHELIRYKRKAIGSSGSWAILKASYRMLRDAKERGFKRILVLQDDLLFHKNFLAEFAKIPSYVKNDWKLLYLGATQHNWTRVLKSKHYYYPAGTADGAFAVGIDSSIFDELMKEIIKFNMPFDSGALRTLQERYLYDSIVLDPNLIIADIRDSDLRHSRDLVTFGKRFRWDVDLYNIDNSL
jgi:hypothetical protein